MISWNQVNQGALFRESATPHTPKTPVRPRLFMSAALFLLKTAF